MNGLPTSTDRQDGQKSASLSTTQAKKVKMIFREVDRALRALDSMPPSRRRQTTRDLLQINEEMCDLFIDKITKYDK